MTKTIKIRDLMAKCVKQATDRRDSLSYLGERPVYNDVTSAINDFLKEHGLEFNCNSMGRCWHQTGIIYPIGEPFNIDSSTYVSSEGRLGYSKELPKPDYFEILNSLVDQEIILTAYCEANRRLYHG